MTDRATGAAADRGEGVSAMAPMMIAEGSPRLREPLLLARALMRESAALDATVPPGLRDGLADLLRVVDAHRSNRLEGRDADPAAIERALRGADETTSDEVLEGAALAATRRWLDAGGAPGRATGTATVLAIHRHLIGRFPARSRSIHAGPGRADVAIVPGGCRTHDVQVGRHAAVSPGAVPRHLAHLEWAYSRVHGLEALAAVPAAHHRLLWIHPFADGNGRVARLAAHAMAAAALGATPFWSVSRALERNAGCYRRHLGACDMTRRNDLDGRGNLSEEALAALTTMMLGAFLDEVRFMAALLERATLPSPSAHGATAPRSGPRDRAGPAADLTVAVARDLLPGLLD